MTADTEEELHEMALLIGMKPEWFQNKSTPHYDLTPSRRKLAVKHGAIEEYSRDRVRRIKALIASETEANTTKNEPDLKNPQNLVDKQ